MCVRVCVCVCVSERERARERERRGERMCALGGRLRLDLSFPWPPGDAVDL